MRVVLRERGGETEREIKQFVNAMPCSAKLGCPGDICNRYLDDQYSQGPRYAPVFGSMDEAVRKTPKPRNQTSRRRPLILIECSPEKKNVISTTAFFEHALRSESRRGNWGGEGWTLIEERDAN